MSEKLIGMLAAASGVAETEVAELIKTDEGIDSLSQTLDTKFTKVRDDADKRATKKTRTDVEKVLKDAGVEDARFDNLPAAIETLTTKAAESATGGKLDEATVLKHPAVVALKNKLTLETEQKVNEARQQEQQKLQQERESFAREQVAAQVREKAGALIDQLQPVFSQNPTVAANQRQRLLADLTSGRYLVENGELVPVDADGEVVKDAQLNPLKFEALVRKTVTDNFDLPVSTDRSAPTLTAEQIAAGARAKQEYTGPKTDDEYANALNATNTAAEREALKTAYDGFKQDSQPAA